MQAAIVRASGAAAVVPAADVAHIWSFRLPYVVCEEELGGFGRRFGGSAAVWGHVTIVGARSAQAQHACAGLGRAE